MAIVTVNGFDFPLDLRPADPVYAATLPQFSEAYADVPEDKWSESDQFATFDPETLFQIQNGCAGHAYSTAFTLAWLAAGYDLPPGGFSPTWAYAMCNGGRDAGASIEEMIAAGQDKGICLAATFPEKLWSPRQATPEAYAEAAKYKLGQAYKINTWAQLGTAIHKGFPVECSVMVGRSFSNIDRDGFAGVDAGPGNHAIVGGGIRRFKGDVNVKQKTSWGKQFGDNGCYYITRQHVECQHYWGQATFTGIVIESVAPAAGPAIVRPA